MEDMAATTLPSGFAYEWTGLAYQEKAAGSGAVLIFLLAVVFVFLVLAAQYESLPLPLAVILIVPMCLLAAMIGVRSEEHTSELQSLMRISYAVFRLKKKKQ